MPIQKNNEVISQDCLSVKDRPLITLQNSDLLMSHKRRLTSRGGFEVSVTNPKFELMLQYIVVITKK